MSIKKTLQNKNKKRFTKEEYKYIESVWNVKNYILNSNRQCNSVEFIVS